MTFLQNNLRRSIHRLSRFAEEVNNQSAGPQIALVQWWLEKRQPHTFEYLAQTFHRLQRAAIRDAFGLRDGE
jgi:hypothetical protein